jgi:hypothetical protein
VRGRPAGVGPLRAHRPPPSPVPGEAGIRDRLKADLLGLLNRAGKPDPDTVIVDGATVRAFDGGEATGPSPVDCRKPGTKHTVMVDEAGIPLAIRSAGANASDHVRILPVLLDFPKVAGVPGRPEGLPDGLCRPGIRQRGDEGVVALAGNRAAHRQAEDPHGSPVKVRRVVERSAP